MLFMPVSNSGTKRASLEITVSPNSHRQKQPSVLLFYESLSSLFVSCKTTIMMDTNVPTLQG
jgi:hypothetical protein